MKMAGRVVPDCVAQSRRWGGAPSDEKVELSTSHSKSLLTFYDFPAEHWIHLKTTNPVPGDLCRLRTRVTKRAHGGLRATVNVDDAGATTVRIALGFGST